MNAVTLGLISASIIVLIGANFVHDSIEEKRSRADLELAVLELVANSDPHFHFTMQTETVKSLGDRLAEVTGGDSFGAAFARDLERGLRRLCAAGYVRRVHQNIYEITDAGRERLSSSG